jgi:hypoxanthine-DNA glycosylase
LRSFPPIIGTGARTLILGTMPGVLSLRHQQYYAHPRNAFWRITGEVFGFAADAPYDDRVDALVANRVAVWDVLEECRRVGSLDSAIETDGVVANDFGALFAAHPDIDRVLFNGAAAERKFLRLVGAPPVPHQRLPSTSPARTLRYADKLAAWRAALV